MSTTPFEPLVSVVTPVYNGERYLEECMESVLSQTYEHWEYLLCDNRSTDRTLEIAQRFGARDDRVRVIRFDEFLPLMANWNRAMRQVSPEAVFVKVVHADDKLYPECLERMVAVGERFPTAALVGAYGRRDDVGVRCVLTPPDLEFVAGREICRRTFLEELEVFGSPTTTLVRASHVRGEQDFYDPGFIHADTEACFRLLQGADLGFVHEVLTYSRLHPEAVTSFTGRVGSWLPERIEMFLRYGRSCLDDAEYEATLRRLLGRYVTLLARRAVRLRLVRDRRIREYHAQSLRRISTALAADPKPSRLGAAARIATGALGRVLGAGPPDAGAARTVRR